MTVPHDPIGYTIEAGPDLANTLTWCELIQDNGLLQGAAFLETAQRNIETAVDMLDNLIGALPQESQPQTIEAYFDLVDWHNPEAHQEFVKMFTDYIEGTE